ncbi:MAG: hypothetical protein AAF514_20375 [Verrucomicrobiota bacterium]
MAGQDDLLSTLGRQAASYDEPALIALGNKGLFRRASKDLQNAPPELDETVADPSAIELVVGAQRVRLVDPLPDSDCDCSSSGVCRHILTGILWLAKQATPTGNQPGSKEEAFTSDLKPEWNDLTVAELQKWAGSPLMQQAVKHLRRGTMAKVDSNGVFEIPDMNQTVRWIPGAGPEGSLCSCHERHACVHRLVAFLTTLLTEGHFHLPPDESRSSASGAPRTREAIIGSCRQLLRETMNLGFSRLGDHLAIRFQSLAVAAHGVDLPRLERALKSLAEEVNLLRNGMALANPHRLLTGCARTAALSRALRKPRPGLEGEHRSHYLEMGRLRLTGLGAEIWQTRSGFLGLTLFFQDQNDHWATWTDARGNGKDPQFDPYHRFDGDGPWNGVTSIKSAANGLITLAPSWRNAEGRLSGRSACRGLRSGPTTPDFFPDPIRDWSCLKEQARRIFAPGLIPGKTNDSLIWLHPREWAPAEFDPVGQRIHRPLIDDNGESLPAVLPVGARKYQRAAAQSLADYKPSPNSQVLGRLFLHRGQPAVHPITLWTGGNPSHLTLEPHRPNARWPKETSSQSDLNEAQGSDLSSLIQRCGDFLLGLAEKGCSSGRDSDEDQLQVLADQCESVGLCLLGQSLKKLHRSLETTRKSTHSSEKVAEALLQSAYLCDVTDKQAALTLLP